MHSIERYGIVALLFLVVTVVAVLMWDGKKHRKKDPAAPPRTAQAAEKPALPDPTSGTRAGDERLSLVAEGQPGPLLRSLAAPPEPLDSSTAAPSAEPAVGTGRPLTDADDVETLQPSTEPQAGLHSSARPEQPAREPVIGRSIASPGATHAYVVRAGDTLSEISQRELGSSRRWSEIVQLNPGLDPARLSVGKSIRLPGQGRSEPAASKSRPETPPSEAARTAGKWTVGAGESLWSISERALGSGSRWREIAALNPGVNPDRLAKGQVLLLPGNAKAGATKPPAKKEPLVASRGGSSRAGRVK